MSEGERRGELELGRMSSTEREGTDVRLDPRRVRVRLDREGLHLKVEEGKERVGVCWEEMANEGERRGKMEGRSGQEIAGPRSLGGSGDGLVLEMEDTLGSLAKS